MLKPGNYHYDVCCKDYKNHLYDEVGNVVFETDDIAKLFDFIRENSNGYEETGPFSYKVW